MDSDWPREVDDWIEGLSVTNNHLYQAHKDGKVSEGDLRLYGMYVISAKNMIRSLVDEDPEGIDLGYIQGMIRVMDRFSGRTIEQNAELFNRIEVIERCYGTLEEGRN